MSNKKTLLKVSLILIGIILLLGAVFITHKLTKEEYEQPEIESLYVFGEKVNVEPKKKVYRIFMDSAKIEYNGNGCIPIPYKITFKNGYKEEGGYSYILNGQNHAYFGIKATKKDNNVYDHDNLSDIDELNQSNTKINHVEDYDVYIEVIFDNPIVVASECSNIEE